MTSSHAHTGAVILAAGSSSRYGALKQLIAIDGEPMVRRITRYVLAAGLHPVVVVVGAQSDRVTDCLSNLDVCAVSNPDWATGMGSSLATGVTTLMSQAAPLQSLMVMLADQPAIKVGDLERMLATHVARPDRILACHNKGDFAPPCIFPLTYVDELMALSGSEGARVLLDGHASDVQSFDLPAAFQDIDTPDDYNAWQTERGDPSTG
ncbi:MULTISPECIES: nucleotidyltransferase family protein [unclassified Dyella]|uniref:nucleotidyltransferase family protein n=1 Tax=unclassified Dyella TaxID=2634549 RepID=UPI000C85CF9F|nr:MULTISPECIES: nucleotidyltransferase family protein [unclassified Dyella]MDR3443656.1 nucleotidyltransferase family protein [Dyella sp.]PMQ03749.1 Nicotine blue oxidoreductase [Dyella sp. AD56]